MKLIWRLNSWISRSFIFEWLSQRTSRFFQGRQRSPLYLLLLNFFSNYYRGSKFKRRIAITLTIFLLFPLFFVNFFYFMNNFLGWQGMFFFWSSYIFHWLLNLFFVWRLERNHGNRFILCLFISRLLFYSISVLPYFCYWKLWNLVFRMAQNLLVREIISALIYVLFLIKAYFFLNVSILGLLFIVWRLVGWQKFAFEDANLILCTILALTIAWRLVRTFTVSNLFLLALFTSCCPCIRRCHILIRFFVLQIRWHKHLKLAICLFWFLRFWSWLFLLVERLGVFTFTTTLLAKTKLALSLIKLFIW